MAHVSGEPTPEHDPYLVLALLRWAIHYLRSQVQDVDTRTRAAVEDEAADLNRYVAGDLDRFARDTQRMGESSVLLPREVQSMVNVILPPGRSAGPEPESVAAREPILDAILGQRPDAGGDLYSLNRALMRAKGRKEPIVRAVPAAAVAGESDRQLAELDGLSQRRVVLLEAGAASLLQVEEFFANATFAPSLVRLDSIPAGGPQGIGIVVPEDDQVVGAAFALRRQADDAVLDELWRPGSARWSFLAHPDVPVALLRFAPSVEARLTPAARWQQMERAFLFDPGQLGPMLVGFLEPGRLIWLVPESVAVRAQMRGAADPGNLYDDMLAHCLLVGAVPEDARPRSVEEAMRWWEHWRQRGEIA
jgi:hypothetical protein